MTAFPITEAFLTVIEDTAKVNNAKRIRKIWLRLGKGVFFKGNTSTYLEYILKGTPARDAEIYIRHGNSAGRCRYCGLVFAYEDCPVCPECGGVRDSILLDKRFIIEKMEVEQ
jgi:Zn finger protein HypA/HybF involved in hydrogenase expression